MHVSFALLLTLAGSPTPAPMGILGDAEVATPLLRDAGIAARPIPVPAEPGSFRAVIATQEGFRPDRAACIALTGYVAGGGTLLVVGRPPEALVGLLGVSRHDPAPRAFFRPAAADLFPDLPAGDAPAGAEVRRYLPDMGLEILARLVLPDPDRGGAPSREASPFVAASIHRYGRGRAALIPWRAFAAYREGRSGALRALVAGTLRLAMDPRRSPSVVQGPPPEGLPPLALATVPPASPPAEVPWTPLFDGRGLAGWVPVGGGRWTVEDGTIVGTNGDGRYGWLATARAYGDFDFEASFRIEAPGNSGIQFRSQVVGCRMKGPQAEVSTGGTGGLWDEAGPNGWKSPTPEARAAFRRGGWNTYRIAARGDRIETFVDGVKANELLDETRPWGILALQVHSGSQPVKVRWKGLRIRDLGYGPGWAPLWNGRDLAGWIVQGKERWTIEDGAITASSGAGRYGHLVSERSFRDFALRLRFRIAGGNSGVYFHTEMRGDQARGIQAEIAAEAGRHTGGLYESYRRAWLVRDIHPDAEALYRPGAWNEMMLRVVGSRYTTWVNGRLAADMEDTDVWHQEGPIALQVHAGGGTRVQFRAIFVKAF